MWRLSGIHAKKVDEVIGEFAHVVVQQMKRPQAHGQQHQHME